MNDIKPLRYRWRGAGFVPEDYHMADAQAQFEDDRVYELTTTVPRSKESHNHYFVCLREAWEQLPEGIAADFPGPNYLRTYALIHTGWFHESIFIASSAKEALRVLKFMRGAISQVKVEDHEMEYVYFSINDNVIVERRAISQKLKLMPKKEDFEKSKNDVLGFAAELAGISLEDLKQHAGKAA